MWAITVPIADESGKCVSEPYTTNLNDGALVADLLQEVAKHLRRTTGRVDADRGVLASASLSGSGRRMRLLLLEGNRISRVLDPAESVPALGENHRLRAEFVPAEQLGDTSTPGTYLVQLAHCLPPEGARPLLQRRARRLLSGACRRGEPSAGPPHGDGGGLAAGSDDGAEAEAAVRAALVDDLPGPAFGEPLLLLVRKNETMGQLRVRIQALLGVPPEVFSRWHLIFVGKVPSNAYLPDNADMGAYLSGHSEKFTPQAAAVAAASGATRAVLIDPQKLTLVAIHEDDGDFAGQGVEEIPVDAGAGSAAGERARIPSLARDFLALLDSPDAASASASDFTLLAGGRSFPVHRLVLAARCEYFRCLFARWADGSADASRELALPTADPDALAALLRYVYGGRLVCRRELLKPTAELAGLLMLTEAREALHERIGALVTSRTVLADLFWAEAQGAEPLLDRLERFYVANARWVEEEAVRQLARANPDLMAHLHVAIINN